VSVDAPTGLDAFTDAFEQLFAAQRRLRGRDAKEIDGISFAQFRLLRTLAREGAMPASKLAAHAGISPASTTQMLDALEKRGLVGRERSDEDRRVVTVALTPEGERRAEARRKRNQRLLEEVFSDLPPGELDIGADVLRRCSAYLDAL
jgi:DNA-binding MarR family transcriptional regulator